MKTLNIFYRSIFSFPNQVFVYPCDRLPDLFLLTLIKNIGLFRRGFNQRDDSNKEKKTQVVNIMSLGLGACSVVSRFLENEKKAVFTLSTLEYNQC